ncbi:MAG TPA: ribonuclease III [Hyphomicrobiales bacterium]|nr:ribonuclease III [Hyphomicrobiales bacterium]
MTRRPVPLDALQARIGHRFSDPALALRALTHLSALDPTAGREESYQRLEFLGDRVLGLVVAAMLFEAFPTAHEGELSRRLAELVRAEACAEVAGEMDLGPALVLGSGEAHSGGRRKRAILADACEALIGAVFLDGGLAAADGLIRRYWQPRMAAPRRPLRDAKTALQEWVQGRGLPAPTYRQTGRAGPDHRPLFQVLAEVPEMTPAEGQGRSKREAEQAAAAAFLAREGVWTEQAE